MKWLKVLFEKQAVIAGQVATVIIGALAAFSVVDMTGEQTGIVMSALVVFGTVLGRRFAWSKQSVDGVARDAYDRGIEDAGRGDYDRGHADADELWAARHGGQAS